MLRGRPRPPSGRTAQGDTGIENPLAPQRPGRLCAVARGAVAGFAGAMVMSASTHLEMRLRGRPPSDAPARALARTFGVRAGGKQRKMQLALAGHLATSVSIGAAGGALQSTHRRPAASGAALFGLALLPEKS